MLPIATLTRKTIPVRIPIANLLQELLNQYFLDIEHYSKVRGSDLFDYPLRLPPHAFEHLDLRVYLWGIEKFARSPGVHR